MRSERGRAWERGWRGVNGGRGRVADGGRRVQREREGGGAVERRRTGEVLEN